MVRKSESPKIPADDKDAIANERNVRLQKLERLRELSILPYKDRFVISHSADAVTQLDRKAFRSADEVAQGPNEAVSLAGRVLSTRDHGGIIFIDIQDKTGVVQVACTESAIGEQELEFVRAFIDPGDFIGICGEPFITKRDTLAVLVARYSLLSKAVRPLPGKHFGITDPEIRFRKRYLDLVLNDAVRERFAIRSQTVESLRKWLLNNDFTEVVTRTLQPTAGGAAAETFVTHHNALNQDFHLRISNEIDLKLAVAGGLGRVFEFSMDFRNEGIDASHLQEFQMLEWYCPYEDYKTGMQWMTAMIRQAMQDTLGTTSCTVFDEDGKSVSVEVGEVIPEISFSDLLRQYDIDSNASSKELLTIARDVGVERTDLEKRSRGGLLDDVYKKIIRPKLLKPIIIVNFPKEVLPLARRSDSNPAMTDSYQLVIGSWELVKGYSELVDPIQQREAFAEQMEARKAGDREAMQADSEFLIAMEHGMPPMTGCGIGIDRLVALMTGVRNLKETVLFPLLSPLPGDATDQ